MTEVTDPMVSQPQDQIVHNPILHKEVLQKDHQVVIAVAVDTAVAAAEDHQVAAVVAEAETKMYLISK